MEPDAEPSLEQTLSSPIAADEVALAFEIGADEMARVLRHPEVQARRTGAVRTSAQNVVWHDTADGALSRAGVVIAQSLGRGGLWRLEGLVPGTEAAWLPATQAPVLGEAVAPELLGYALPGPLAPAAAFRGRLRSVALLLPSGPATLGLLSGELRGVTDETPACRVLLSGPAGDCAALALAMAGTLRLRPPLAGLAEEGLALARQAAARPRRLGAPSIPPGGSAAEALGCVAAHLADVILHWAAEIPTAETPEAVHQMRVGVRRLRSALSVFRRAVEDEQAGCAWLDELSGRLRGLAGRLGVARDWDVFVTETAADVSAAFPQDRRVEQMMAAAGRKRLAAYADVRTYLAGQEWTRLAMALALLPTQAPWRGCPGGGVPARDYAAHALSRRLKNVLSPGCDLSGLPTAQLHEIRKQAKRLRYATEFFAPLFADKAVRKYLPRLEDLQEALGAVNDTEVAAGLTRQLEGGADRAFAAGVVQGFGAARAGRAAARVQRIWDRFYRATPFWN